ncbi:MAG: S8 family serine peptidase [Thiotrichales bacterium]|nr:S8 family serine peptidase [Thiotrichales bacterium]
MSNRKNRIRFVRSVGLTAVLALLLNGCGGGSSSAFTPLPESNNANTDSQIVDFNDPLLPFQWPLENTGQPSAPGNAGGGRSGEDINLLANGIFAQGFTGNGVKLAVIDIGLQLAHPDLVTNLVPDASYNFANNGLGLHDPTLVPSTFTPYDHGTSVAGIIGARGGNRVGISGVAPSVELRGYNYLMAQDFPNEFAALGHQPTLDGGDFSQLTSAQVDVFNLSYGRVINYVLPAGQASYYDQLIEVYRWGTENLRAGKGAIYLKAAGNEFIEGAGNCTQANEFAVTCLNSNMEPDQTIPYVLPIAAFNDQGVRSEFSNTGASIWLAAPGGGDGSGILTTDHSGCNQGYSQTNGEFSFNDFDRGLRSENENCDYFSAFAGTSAAVPHVSGAAALLLEANPDLTWRDLKQLFARSARKLDANLPAVTLRLGLQTVTLENGWVTNAAGLNFSNAYGFGALDVNRALTLATSNYPNLPPQQVWTQVGSVSNGGVIADASATGITETLSVSQNLQPVVESVQLRLSLAGVDERADGQTDFDFSDYQIILQSPSGTQSVVMTPFHSFDKRFKITDYPMITHAFYGEPLNGEWRLLIRDLDSSGNLDGQGKLVNWSLRFYGHTPS